MSVINKLENYLKQLAHPFYKRVDDWRNEVKREALEKAAEKYPEPFNWKSWTSRQLMKHAMSENYDQGNYIVGLYEKCVDLEERNEYLEKVHARLHMELGQLQTRNEFLESWYSTRIKERDIALNEAEYWRLRAEKNAGNIKAPGTHNKPKYADLDD